MSQFGLTEFGLGLVLGLGLGCGGVGVGGDNAFNCMIITMIGRYDIDRAHAL